MGSNKQPISELLSSASFPLTLDTKCFKFLPGVVFDTGRFVGRSSILYAPQIPNHMCCPPAPILSSLSRVWEAAPAVGSTHRPRRLTTAPAHPSTAHVGRNPFPYDPARFLITRPFILCRWVWHCEWSAGQRLCTGRRNRIASHVLW